MKAIFRKDPYEYTEPPEYCFISGNKYDVKVDRENYLTIIVDENNIEFCFCGEPKHLEDIFDFVEE